MRNVQQVQQFLNILFNIKYNKTIGPGGKMLDLLLLKISLGGVLSQNISVGHTDEYYEL